MIAFDIGGTNSRITLFDQGKIVLREEAPTPSREGPEAVVQNMLALHSRLGALDELDAPVGVAIAGHIVDGRVTAHNEALLTGWNDYPLQSKLSAELGRTVHILNDARAAAWGEYIFGAGRGIDEFLFITVSTGVGAGLVLNRRLHIARNGFDAEIGVTRTEGGAMLEDLASGSALARMAAQNGYASGKALCDAADQGDARAEAMLRHGIREIAKKLADLAVMLGVQRVAVGGSVGLRPGYLERLRDELAQLGQLYQIELVHAQLGHDAGLYGVAALAQGS